MRIDINGHTLSWDPIPGAASYDLLRGPFSGAFAYTHSCRFTGFTNPIVDDGPIPAVDSGFYYLARGVNVCGAGSLGAASDATPRPNPPCP